MKLIHVQFSRRDVMNKVLIFSNDYQGSNNCPGGCAVLWPYFNAGHLTQDNLGNGLLLSDFDSIVDDPSFKNISD